jgi:hypothetical protein
MAQPGGQVALQVAVGPGRAWIGPEGIAEGEMTVEGACADGADIQVMGRGAGRGGEGFAARHPQVALVPITEGTDRLRSCWKVAGQLGS